MPRLGFADEKKVIIYDDNGIYIFNLVSGKLDGYFDFKQNGLGGLQEAMLHLSMFLLMETVFILTV